MTPSAYKHSRHSANFSCCHYQCDSAVIKTCLSVTWGQEQWAIPPVRNPSDLPSPPTQHASLAPLPILRPSSTGLAAHLAPAGRALCHTLGSHQALVEMKGLEPIPLCTRGGWTESCPQQGTSHTQGLGRWSEDALLKGGDSSTQRQLQPGDRGRLRVNEGSGGPMLSPTLHPTLVWALLFPLGDPSALTLGSSASGRLTLNHWPVTRFGTGPGTQRTTGKKGVPLTGSLGMPAFPQASLCTCA